MFEGEHSHYIGSIEQMNQMYRLQVSNVPTLRVVDPTSDGRLVPVPASERLKRFKSTLLDEIKEIDACIEMAEAIEQAPDHQSDLVALLTAIADVTGDIVVFCTSEQRKFGLPAAAIMQTIMASNMSKLYPDGSARYDDNGKFLKGPNYWKPEPMISQIIQESLAERPVEVFERFADLL